MITITNRKWVPDETVPLHRGYWIMGYAIDNESELVNLPKFPQIGMGSTALVPSTMRVFALDSEGWK